MIFSGIAVDLLTGIAGRPKLETDSNRQMTKIQKDI